MKKENYYILFNTHTEGMKLKSYLEKERIHYIISPTPRQLSVSCGISIMYEKHDEQRIKQIVEKNDLSIKGFFELECKVKNFYA